MCIEGRNQFYKVIALCMFLFMAGSPVLNVVALDIPSDLNVGPYVDKVVYKLLDYQFPVMQTDQIDFMTEYLVGDQIQIAEEDPDICTSTRLRNGYGIIIINCAKYPFNISAFRRAFAFAFDKTRVTTDILDGFSQEHDSMVPYLSPWCIEDDMPYHYYTAQVDIGNQILDQAGFTIDTGTGYRVAPNGSEFNVVIEYPFESPEVAGGTCQIGVDALQALHINAETRARQFIELITRVNGHGDYDMAFYAEDFDDCDVDWLAYEFWSGYVDVPHWNPSNFVNDTYDSWRDQLLRSITYEEVFEASARMQLILHENVPKVVAYVNIMVSAYRCDVFTGQVKDIGRWIGSQWTLRKIHKIDGTPGGTVRIAFGTLETLNLFNAWSTYAEDFLINLFPSLYSRAPDIITPWPNLVENLLEETHADNKYVQEGHTRFTMDIIRNATWSDGTPITAEDVAFTFTYLFESHAFGNPIGVGLINLIAAYTPIPHRVVLEFSTESWWHFSNVAFKPIIPEHIFNNEDGIGYEGWNRWNPAFDPTEPFITAGPFKLTDWVIGEFFELSTNPDFWYYPQEVNNTYTATTTTSSPSTPTTNDQDYNQSLVVLGGAVGAAVTVFVGGFILYRKELPSN